MCQSFSSIQQKILEEMSLGEFQDGCYGGHPVYLNGMILTNLNLYTAPMLPGPTKIKFNPRYSFRGDFNV